MTKTSGVTLCAVVILGALSLSQGSESGLEDQLDYHWETATLLEDNTGNAWSPEIAVDASGNAIAVWSQSDGDRYNIWSNRFTVEAGWGEATLIEIINSGDAVVPQVAFDNSGNAIAVWQQNNGTRYCIYSNRYTVGTGWESATLIESFDSEGAFDPQIAVDDSGNAIVVWQQDDGNLDSIYSNRYVVGTGWETPTHIGTTGHWWEEHSRVPQIAMDGSGNAIAVWEQWDFIRFNIWANRYVAGVGWGSATPFEANNSGNARLPQVAVDDSGNAIAVWDQHDGFRHSIYSNRYAVATGWGNAMPVEDDDIGENFAPRIAVDGSGNAMVVWKQIEAAYLGTVACGVKANRYVAGTGWQGVTIVEEYDSGMIGYPSIVASDCGNALAVWGHIDSGRISICSSGYDVEVGWGPTSSFGTGESLDAGDPQVAIDDSSNAIVVWWQYDGTTYDIWSNRYIWPDPSPSSIMSTTTVFAVIAVGASIVVVSSLWLRRRKAGRYSKSIEEEEPRPPSS